MRRAYNEALQKREEPGVNRKTADYLVIALAAVLSAGSIGLFAWDARPTFVPLMWPPRAALAWDAFLSLVFFVQHCGMVRRPFRAHLRGESPRSTARSTRRSRRVSRRWRPWSRLPSSA